MDLGRKIEQARRQAGFAPVAFARAVGVSYATLWRWESNKQNPNLGHLKEISRLTGKSIDWLAK